MVKYFLFTLIAGGIVIGIIYFFFWQMPAANIEKKIEDEQKVLGEKEKIPSFDDYSIPDFYAGDAAEIDFESHPQAREFRARLIDASGRGPVFAGHYAVSEIGCGSSCQTYFLIDLISGDVVRVGDQPAARGAQFQIDSGLFILDPPYGAGTRLEISDPSLTYPARYYVIENGKLRRIAEIPCRVENGSHICR